MVRVETVVICHTPSEILLGMKKKRFGVGKFNGFGGRVEVEKGENIYGAAIRETYEEAGIEIINPLHLGTILFEFETGEQDHLVYFFKATNYKGVPVETEEMLPSWFNLKNIPYDQMWEDDKYWLPLLLEGKSFRGNFIFNKDHKIAKYSFQELSQFTSSQ